MPKPNGIPAEALVAAMAIAGVGCWLWDTETRHLQISENFQTLLGLPPDGLPETPDAWLALAHTDDRQHLVALFDRLTTSTTHGPSGFNLRLKHSSGLWHWFDVRPPASGQAA